MTETESSCKVELLNEAYNNFELNKSCSFRKTPLLPLNINNFEISIIQYRYLCYWIKHKETPYIKTNYLLQILGFRGNDQIDYNTFFIFFCIMTLSQFDRIIKVILSACGIHSNYGVSKEKVELFFTTISGTAIANEQIQNFLNINNDLIIVKDLTTFVEINRELYNPFWQMRISLIKHFFIERYFVRILKRIVFYDNAYSSHLDIPPESCFSSFYRTLVLKEPPPYYTEYRDVSINPKDCEELFDMYMVIRRKKYGYSKRINNSRPHSYVSEGINDRRSSYHSNNKSSQKITPKKSQISINQVVPHVSNT